MSIIQINYKMKNIALYFLPLFFMTCSQSPLTHTDTVKIVVESFYEKDNSKLKKHTTDESYASFISVQDMMAPGNPSSKTSDFKIIQETINGDVAWVKFSTSYSEKPETFKLTKKDGQWKVMEQGLREKSPF